MTKICRNCGEPIVRDNATYCSSCGKTISRGAEQFGSRSHSNGYANASERSFSNSSTPPAQIKSPFLALILSYFWIGAGQLYNGKFWKGLFFSFAVLIITLIICILGIRFLFSASLFILVLPLIWIIYIWSMWDAYNDSKKINRGELPDTKPTIGEIAAFICLPVIFSIAIFIFLFLFLRFYYYL
jgi:hypothetical protein